MAENEISVVSKALNWAYDKSLNGLPGQKTAVELAEDYLKGHDKADDAIHSLIKWQAVKCGASGFLTGFGGFITLPFTMPVDLAATYFVNIRMVAAIAHIRGYDLRSDQTRTMVLLALVGDSAGELVSKAGVSAGAKIAPVIGGFVGGAINSMICAAIGKSAMKLLKPRLQE